MATAATSRTSPLSASSMMWGSRAAMTAASNARPTTVTAPTYVRLSTWRVGQCSADIPNECAVVHLRVKYPTAPQDVRRSGRLPLLAGAEGLEQDGERGDRRAPAVHACLHDGLLVFRFGVVLGEPDCPGSGRIGAAVRHPETPCTRSGVAPGPTARSGGHPFRGNRSAEAAIPRPHPPYGGRDRAAAALRTVWTPPPAPAPSTTSRPPCVSG